MAESRFPDCEQKVAGGNGRQAGKGVTRFGSSRKTPYKKVIDKVDFEPHENQAPEIKKLDMPTPIFAFCSVLGITVLH
jgi:hypothetical protein